MGAGGCLVVDAFEGEGCRTVAEVRACGAAAADALADRDGSRHNANGAHRAVQGSSKLGAGWHIMTIIKGGSLRRSVHMHCRGTCDAGEYVDVLQLLASFFINNFFPSLRF